MFIMKVLIISIYIFVECLCVETVFDLDGAVPYIAEVKEDESVPNDSNEILNATLFKSVKKYYCRAETVDDLTNAELLVYGTRAWTFPAQDVKLTLRYPSEHHKVKHDIDHIDYVLTGLRVIFYLSGADSQGYITSGGMHQDHISMMFEFRNITSLSYQFFLHGIQRSLLNITENYTATVNLC